MDTAPIRIFHLRGHTVQLLAGLLLLIVGFRIYGEDVWKGVFVFVGSLPVVITATLLRCVEVAEGCMRICLRIGHFIIPCKDAREYRHRHFFGSWVGLQVRTSKYPLWALPFCWAMNFSGKSIILNPIFFVESAVPRRTGPLETLFAVLVFPFLLFLAASSSSILIEDMRISEQVLPLKVQPPGSDYLCIIGPYRDKLSRQDAVELDEAQWREASSVLQSLYYDNDRIPGVVLIAKRGKFRTEKLRLAAGRGLDLAWKEAKYNDFVEQVCVRVPYYQIHDVDSRKLFRLLARKPH